MTGGYGGQLGVVHHDLTPRLLRAAAKGWAPHLDFRFRPYDPRQAYAESKTAAVMLAVEASRRWSADGIYANAVNPGAIATGLQKYTGGLKTAAERRKSVEQGAATSVFLAASPLA
jgi:NAD(P)-dependent dehydrogenase (short-subunit alcohol dehydrogenase family)